MRQAAPPAGVAEPVPLRDAASIQKLLEQFVADAAVMPNTPRRAQALATLLNLALRLVEVGDIEGRLAALEAAADRHQRLRVA